MYLDRQTDNDIHTFSEWLKCPNTLTMIQKLNRTISTHHSITINIHFLRNGSIKRYQLAKTCVQGKRNNASQTVKILFYS